MKSGEPIFEIETDKVTAEVVAESAGILKHLAKAGDTVQIGQVVASIDDKAPAPAEAEPKKEEANGTAKAPRAEAAAPVAAVARGKNADDLSPAVRYQTEEKGINPAAITGTGKDGRILKGDVLAIESAKAAATGTSGVDKPTVAPAKPTGARRGRSSHLCARKSVRAFSAPSRKRRISPRLTRSIFPTSWRCGPSSRTVS